MSRRTGRREHPQLVERARAAACRGRRLPPRGRGAPGRRPRARARRRLTRSPTAGSSSMTSADACGRPGRRRPHLRASAAARRWRRPRPARRHAPRRFHRSEPAVRAAPASAAIASVRLFNCSTTASISRRASRIWCSIALVEPALERLFAIAQLLLPRLQLRRRRFELVALAGRQPPLVIERLHVALDFGEVFGELRLARAAMLARLLDDRGRQPEPGRDLERQAAAGRAVVQPIRRRERRPDRIRTPPGMTPSVVAAYDFSAS